MPDTFSYLTFSGSDYQCSPSIHSSMDSHSVFSIFKGLSGFVSLMPTGLVTQMLEDSGMVSN